MMHLREARWEDCRIIFDLANDKSVRDNAINSNAIDWESHQNWFKAKLISSGTKFLVLEIEGEFVGQVRFDYSETDRAWFIDYSIKEEYRGQGLGMEIIRQALVGFKRGDILAAFVKQENLASLAIFKKLGFSEETDSEASEKGLIKFKYLL